MEDGATKLPVDVRRRPRDAVGTVMKLSYTVGLTDPVPTAIAAYCRLVVGDFACSLSIAKP